MDPKELHTRFLIAVKLGGTNVEQWCRDNGLCKSNLYAVFCGQRKTRTLIEAVERYTAEQFRRHDVSIGRRAA